MSIKSCFAYNGRDFSICEESTAVQIAGNAIVLWNTKTGQKDYIWSKRSGYCMTAANYNKNIIAAAEYGLNPEVHIYGLPNMEIVHTFPMDTTVKCISMTFSRDGRYLLMIGGVPDFRLSIYDLDESKKLVIPETKLPCKPEEFLSAKFNPSNKDQFAILSQTALYNFFIHPAYDVTERGEKKFLAGSHRLEHTCYKDENPELTYTKFIWDPQGRVHLCTDLPMIVQIDPKTNKLENTVNLSSRPATCLLTQKHLIVALEEGLLIWLKIEMPPEHVLNEKDAGNQCLKVLEEIEQEWSFNVKIGESDIPDYLTHIHYTRSFSYLVCGTETGIFGTLEIQAERNDEDEEEEEVQENKEKTILRQEFKVLGRFHTQRLTGIKELGQTTQLVTISEDHYMSVWEATSQVMLASVFQPAHPTAVDVSKDGTSVFLGTAMGAFRIYDVRARRQPRLVLQMRFFEDAFPIDMIKTSKDGDYVLVTSSQSCNVFILSQHAKDKFIVYGYITFAGYIKSASFVKINGQVRIVAVLHNNLLAGAVVPDKPCENRMEAMPDVEACQLYRKIDRGSNMVITTFQSGDILVTGEDKLLKAYDYPNEQIEQIEWKRAAAAPTEECNSHAVGTACWHESTSAKQIVTGGRDGTILLRKVTTLLGAPLEPIKAHAVHTGGVTAICYSSVRNTVYSAGGDGSFMAHTVGGHQNPTEPVKADVGLNEELGDMPEVERVPGNQIRIYKDILLEEFNKQQEQAKQEFRSAMMLELMDVKKGLMTLLSENERVTDLERLERDEFVIDVSRKNTVFNEGEKECDEIRKEADKTVLRLQLLRDRVKKSTYDTMEVQSKAIQSIQSDTLIFNYPIRKRNFAELRRLNQVESLRKIEIREKLNHMEQKLKECLDEEQFSKDLEDYFMNRVQGTPKYIDDTSIIDAAAEYAAKDAEKKAKRDKMDLNLNKQQTSVQGKKQPRLKITKGKLGTKTKKKDLVEDDAMAGKDKGQTREMQKSMEEMHWTVHFQKLSDDEVEKKLQFIDAVKERLTQEEVNMFDLIYEPFDLYTDVRKRNQIEIIKGVIFQLKKNFNKEFKELEQYKQDRIFDIIEKNKQIQELLENLKQEEELEDPETNHPLENPDAILEVSEKEVMVERYYTKAEREAQEAERKKEEERLAALMGDNVGQRGLKFMLGGTELNLKKEKNKIEELPREDWMSKPFEEMTDEEKTKMKEHEQKEKDLKDKQRKAWDQELKKIKEGIIEEKIKFEERLSELFKKKLFYDVRILEQELYLIRLVIMLHDGKETRFDEKKYRVEMAKLLVEKEEHDKLIQSFNGFKEDLEGKVANDESIKDQDRELKKMFPDNQKAILAFVRTGKTKKAANLGGETNPREIALSKGIIDLDPFCVVDKARVKEILKEEEEQENYEYERDNVAGLTPEEFEQLVEQRLTRAEMEKDKERLRQQITQLQDHINYLADKLRNVEEQYEAQVLGQKKAADRINKIRYNFETIVYMKQGQVEVPQLPVATDYKDAILVSKDVIDFENHEIIKRGDAKVKLMNSISEYKTSLARVKYQKRRLELEILDFEERAKDVQLYRVTKQTQEIIQGKHQKKDEEDKKRFEKKTKGVEENAEKRIRTINETKKKLKKEIAEKKMESEQLENRARQLQRQVEQRMQIMSLKSNTMSDNEADPSKKIKEIAHKRKLLDIAKQQTEEIEVLRDELDRLRARTFPSFAHLHNKPGYPDEN